MKPAIFAFVLLITSPLSIYAAPIQSPNYKKIFTGKHWQTSHEFKGWAESLGISKENNGKCSNAIKDRIAEVKDGVLYCQKVGQINLAQENASATLVWALIRKARSSQYGHDCNAGLVYLSQTEKIAENSPVDCAYVQKIDDPASVPVSVFRVKSIHNIGIVFDGHGAECAGRAVLEQMGNVFKQVYSIYWNCSQ